MTAHTSEKNWVQIVRGAVVCTAEQADTIGRMCFEAEMAGEPCSAWHQAAKYFGTPCHCRRCNPD